MAIHPTAVIDRKAEVHTEAEIGPYVVIEGPVHVGRGTRVLAHATLCGWTHIGADNVVHMGAVIGHEPQDLSYRGEESYVRIGDRNVIREMAQVHRGAKAGSETVLGNDNYLMATAHVGHNCRVGNGVILTNGCMLGGYVEVGDRAIVSGNCVVHQFVRVGRLALMRGLSRAARDVPPFCITDWTHTVRGVNRVGLKRAGFGAAQTRAVQNAVARLFRRATNLSAALAEIDTVDCAPEVRELIDFIRASRRGVSMGPRRGRADEES